MGYSAALSLAKRRCHRLIDELVRKGWKRKDVYIFLSGALDMPLWMVHIERFGFEKCGDVIRILGNERKRLC
jgi:hypothetical protein